MKIKIVLTVLFVVWTVLIVRIYNITIKSNVYYDKLATRNTIKKELIAPIRGEILDIAGKPLAINQFGFKILCKPHLSHKKNNYILEKEIDFLIKMLPDLKKEKLIKAYKRKDSSYNHHNIELISFVEYEKVLPFYSYINLRKNLTIKPAPRRYYPYGKLASHVLGYVAKANRRAMKKDKIVKLTHYVGKNGLEKYYNHYLQGKSGFRTIKVTAFNEEMKGLSMSQPDQNKNITTTLDIELQSYIDKIFTGLSGAVVVMKKDGSILAAGSYPEYNLNSFVMGISSKEWAVLRDDINLPFTNKLINGLYPPGSIIKPSMELAILKSKRVKKGTQYYCDGGLKLGKRTFRCWKTLGHGRTDMVKAIRESCDYFFYKASKKVGINLLAKNLKRYNLEHKTNVDLPNEFIGTIPDKAWKRKKYNRSWYVGETLNASIGQGNVLVTPMQMAQNTMLIATGRLVTPHFVKAFNDVLYKPKYKEVFTEQEKKNLKFIRKGMRDVCSHPSGTATRFIHTKIKIAGKTGTAQVIGIPQNIKKRIAEHDMSYFRRSHAWLTTYGPYKDPQISVTILVEHGGHGGMIAGPIVSKIYNYLKKKHYFK